jgi:outer membrane scaffolding protein for murein synthesis (MipA/OmpV family)
MQLIRGRFGVSGEESAASGLPQYATRSGLRDIHVGLNATYTMNAHWSADLTAQIGRLEKYAAGSPITERRLDLNGMASVSYHF